MSLEAQRLVAADTLAGLSRPDFLVLYYFGKGLKSHEIEALLGVSANTLRSRLVCIRRHMECETTAQCVATWGLAGQPSELPRYAYHRTRVAA